jgi:putative membrane protein
MDPALQAYVTGLPVFLFQGSLALLLWSAGVGIYVALTPHNEFKLVREGNVAAGMTLGAAVIGIAIPMAATLSTSHSLLDLAVWGATSLVLQLAAFRVVDFLIKDLSGRIAKGEVAAASVLMGVKLGTALITASALVG